MGIIQGPDKKYPKMVAGLAIPFTLKKDGQMENNSLKHMAAEAFVQAVESGDPETVWNAFHDMFQLCEMEPHGEYGSGE